MGLADNVAVYVGEIKELADKMRKSTDKTTQMVNDGIYAAALDPTKTLGPPAIETPVPHFNFAPLENALGRLQVAAKGFDAVAKKSNNTSEEINQLLYTSVRLLSRDEGLAGRTWYKHHIYAPGFYTGYGVKTIPGVRESIEQREYHAVEPQIEIAAEVLNRMSGRIELLTSKLGDE